MTKYIVFLTVTAIELVSYLIQNTTATPVYRLTPCKEIIETFNRRTLECDVGVGQYLDYRDVRIYTSTASGSSYNVTITCNGGRIYLPWPFRASHVTILEVRNCGTDGFLAEYSDARAVATELEELSFENLRTKLEVKDLFAAVSSFKNMSKKSECGQVNTRKQRYVNIEYEFGFDMTSSTDIMMFEQLLSTDALKRDFLRSGGNCIFPNLEFFEESGSRSVSSVHFKLMESSLYPKLKEYIAKNNSLSRVPKELRNLNLLFLPNIEKLDLSYNSISELNFVFPALPGKQLHVNLRGNLIKQLDSATVNMLQRSDGIVFDLRDNPLACTCSLAKYGKYLLAQYTKGSLVTYHGMRCWSMRNGQRKKHYLWEPLFKSKFC